MAYRVLGMDEDSRLVESDTDRLIAQSRLLRQRSEALINGLRSDIERIQLAMEAVRERRIGERGYIPRQGG